MTSEDISLIATEPFISKFVFAIIKNIQAQNFSYEDRQVIHADLVPKFSEKVVQSSLREKEVPSSKGSVEELVASVSKPIVKTLIRKSVQVFSPPPVSFPRGMQRPLPQHLPPLRQTPVAPPPAQPVSSLKSAPSVPKVVEPIENYGRITPLLNDPVISLIECPGAEKPIGIIRAGQRQITRINLSPEEIKGILNKISDAAHLPLLEGVFQAIVDDFSINAIISEMVGSKFVIRKKTPYSLLERQV